MITLYDIPSNYPGKAYSPNTFKARTALLFKGLEFKTEWVEFPDIAPLLKKLGVAPTGGSPDKPHYTLPVIHDSSTGKYIVDSFVIAMYLDDTYPDKPTLFPFGTRAPIDMLETVFKMSAVFPLIKVLISEAQIKLSPRSQEFQRVEREPLFKKKLEDFVPPGPERDAMFAASKAGFAKVANLLAKNGDGTLPFFYGETISYADLVLVSYLVYMKAVLGPEWSSQVEEWDGGRWKTLLRLTKQYQIVDSD